jgi:urease accessory protein
MSSAITPAGGSRWDARLDLRFAHREGRSVLTRNLHFGPLQVQKVLYPEGPRVCHVAVLHPPGGIAGGDALTCEGVLEAASMACLTTPGATKWYRCPDAASSQRLHFKIADGAALEWLPRENILFDGSRIRMQLDVELTGTGQFLGWEILCFGRRASGERWASGRLSLHSTINRAGRLLWSERAQVEADGGFAASPVGLGGASVSGTFVVAGPDAQPELLAACRGVLPRDLNARCGITSLPGVMLARYLGHSSEDAFAWFTSLWKIIRPAHLHVAAVSPRLWAC